MLQATQHQGLIPDDIKDEIVKKALGDSIALNLCKVEEMTAPTVTIPVLADVKGSPAFVNELDSIPIVEPQIVDVTLEAKRITCIIPFTGDFKDLTDVDVLNDLKDVITQTLVNQIDKAILVGDVAVGNQSTQTLVFPTPILNAAKQNQIEVEAADNIVDKLSDAIEDVTGRNFPVTNILSNLKLENTIRKMKDTTENYLFADTNTIFGKPVKYTNKLDEEQAISILGDFDKARIGIYKDFNYEIFNTGSYEKADGTSVNLLQQYGYVLRVTAWVAFNLLYKDAFTAVVKAPTL